MTGLKEPTEIELELRSPLAAPEPSPDDDDAPDADITEDETQLPSSDEEFVHEDIWSDPDI